MVEPTQPEEQLHSAVAMTNPGEHKDAITHVAQAPQAIATQKVDAAAKFLQMANIDHASFTYEEERAVLRRIDLRVLPLLLGAYFADIGESGMKTKTTKPYTTVKRPQKRKMI